MLAEERFSKTFIKHYGWNMSREKVPWGTPDADRDWFIAVADAICGF